jgi:hypothetical protein
MRILKQFLLFTLLSCLAVSSAYASQPTLSFTSIPTAQDLPVDGTQTLTYTVHNNVPTAPQQIIPEVLPNTGSTEVINQVSDSCNGLVPAGGDCNVIVKINAGTATGTVNETLNVLNNARQADLTAQITFSVTGSAPAATLVFTSQPTTPQTIDSGNATTLTYQIQNTSSIAAVYQASASPSDTNYMTTTITSDPCAGSIGAGQVCTISVQAIAHTVTVSEFDSVSMTINYGTTHPFTSVLNATPVEFTINVVAADLSFVPPNPLVPNLTPGETGTPLVYTLSNSSGAPIAITPVVTPSQYDSVVALTNSCGGSVPPGVGTCTVSVTLKANSDISVTTPVFQALDIQYQGTKHLIAPLQFAITVSSSTALVFVPAQPAPKTTSIPVNTQSSTPTFTYTIQNTSTAAIAFQAVTPNAVTANDAVTFTNSCGGVVPANNGTCDINVYVVTNSTPTTVGNPVVHALNVNFGPNYSYRIAFIPTFSVNVTAGTGLIFSQVSAPNSQIIDGTAQQLLFKVQNTNVMPAQLTGISIANNASNTGVSTTSITYAPIPGTDTPCYNGSSFASLTNGQSCDFNVNISAPAATSTAGNVIQYLNVASTSSVSPTITQQLTYSVLTSALSFVAEPAPQDMAVGETQTLIYGIHNSDATQAIAFNQAGVAFGTFPDSTPAGAGLISTVFTNTCNGIVPPNGNCSISAAITANAVGSVRNLALIIPNAGGSTLLESTFPVTFQITNQAVSSRTLTFTNSCPGTTIWIGLNGGASNNAASSSAPPNPHIAPGTSSICNTNADCPNGATCVTTNVQTNSKLCFWNSMTPVGGYALASGASTTVTIPEYNQVVANDKNTVWSGNVSARTGCSTGGLCQTADCTSASTTVTAGVNVPNSTGACFPGTGFTPPNALAEFTLSRASSDFYDISIINGANIPISMVPNNLTAYQTTQHGNNGYICGGGGITAATPNGASAATWSFTAPASPTGVSPNQYTFVLYDANQPNGCTTNAACNMVSPGTVCGLTFNPSTNGFRSQCGVFAGYWTGDQICGTSNGSGASPNFNCTSAAGMSSFPSATVTDLYKCDVGIPSCYNNPQGTNQCCGCVNWDGVTGVGVPAAPLVEACPATTPSSPTQWNNLLQFNGNGAPNVLAWLKTAVPSAYTYPYDDPSSTFTCPDCAGGPGQAKGSGGCSVPASEFNTSNYTITFCPGGALIPTPP